MFVVRCRTHDGSIDSGYERKMQDRIEFICVLCLACYLRHYFAREVDGVLEETWRRGDTAVVRCNNERWQNKSNTAVVRFPRLLCRATQ